MRGHARAASQRKPQKGMTGGAHDGITPDDTYLRTALIAVGAVAVLCVMRALVRRFTLAFCFRSIGTSQASDVSTDATNLTLSHTPPDAVLVDEARPSAMAQATVTCGPNGVPLCTLDEIAPLQVTTTCDDELCAICLDAIEAEQRVRMLPCTHVFHDHCIVRWLCRANRCPVCNHPPMEVPESEKPLSPAPDLAQRTEDAQEEELTRLLAQALGENRLLHARLARARASLSRRWRRVRTRRGDNAPAPEVTNPAISALPTQSPVAVAV